MADIPYVVRWRRAIRDAELAASAKLVAFCVAEWVNADGIGWVSTPTLAEGVALSAATVRRALGRLERAGLLEREPLQDERGADIGVALRLIDPSIAAEVIHNGARQRAPGRAPVTGGGARSRRALARAKGEREGELRESGERAARVDNGWAAAAAVAGSPGYAVSLGGVVRPACADCGTTGWQTQPDGTVTRCPACAGNGDGPR